MHTTARWVSDISGVATKEHGLISLAGGTFGLFLSDFFGGLSAALTVLLWLVIGDYVTGLIASVIDGTGLSSRVGFVGIAKKVTIFFMVLIAHKLDLALAINVCMNVVTYFYVTNELISLIENLGRMGIPVPKKIIDIVQALKGKGE